MDTEEFSHLTDQIRMAEQTVYGKPFDVNGSLIVAASAGHIEVVKYLLTKDVTVINESLVVAARNGHFEIVVMLVDY